MLSKNYKFVFTVKQIHILLVVGVALAVIGFCTRHYTDVYFVLITSAIIVSGITLVFRPEEKIQMSKSKDRFSILVIASALYAVIAGLALKDVFENIFYKKLMVEISNSLNNTSIADASLSVIYAATMKIQYDILMMVAFVTTAIPFYHGAAIFLSEHTKFDPEHKKLLFVNFGFLFAQSIILLGFALSLGSFLLSIGMLILLMTLSSFWVIIARVIVKDNPPPLGWLSLNVGFSGTILLTIHHEWTPIISSGYLAIICLLRTVIDYKCFKNMYVGHYKDDD